MKKQKKQKKQKEVRKYIHLISKEYAGKGYLSLVLDAAKDTEIISPARILSAQLTEEELSVAYVQSALSKAEELAVNLCYKDVPVVEVAQTMQVCPAIVYKLVRRARKKVLRTTLRLYAEAFHVQPNDAIAYLGLEEKALGCLARSFNGRGTPIEDVFHFVSASPLDWYRQIKNAGPTIARQVETRLVAVGLPIA